jgi:acetyl esterase
VAYRQAPEHPFPAATDDAFAAYKWLLQNAKSIGADPSKIAIVGESAGGNLAAVTCIKAKETGISLPIHQVLVYPVTDLTFSGSSHRECANASPLNEPMMKWFRKYYLKNEADAHSPYVSPIFSTQLAGLPSATIITAELDPLCSDGEGYADRLELAGVHVQYQRFDGVAHEFFGAKAVLSEAKKAIALAADSLKNAAGTLSNNHPGMTFNPVKPMIEGGNFAASGEF